MRRIAPVKSQEDLESDIFCLKRQLTLILDENQLLKVKIRRLENELRRKDRYIECFQSDTQKNREAGRFVYENGASMIYKLQKRNEELEDLLLERNLQNEKRYNDIKTMCLYSQSIAVDCHQANRRTGSKSSLQNIYRTNSRPVSRSNSPSRGSTARKPSRMRSSNSLKSDNSSIKETKNDYFSSSVGDCRNSGRSKYTESNEISRGFLNKSPHLETIAEKRLMRMKNAEISRLSAELRETKNQLRKQKSESMTRSTSTTLLSVRSRSIDHRDVSLVRTNFIEENRRNVSRSRVKRDPTSADPSRRKISAGKINKTPIKCPIKEDNQAEVKKLPTLHELNEETMSSLTNSDNKSTICSEKNDPETASSRVKTRIEYVYDSEVSSDGEEFCLPSNLRNFLQRTVNTMSSGNGTGVNSD